MRKNKRTKSPNQQKQIEQGKKETITKEEGLYDFVSSYINKGLEDAKKTVQDKVMEQMTRENVLRLGGMGFAKVMNVLLNQYTMEQFHSTPNTLFSPEALDNFNAFHETAGKIMTHVLLRVGETIGEKLAPMIQEAQKEKADVTSGKTSNDYKKQLETMKSSEYPQDEQDALTM
jgi:hypothetical protein